MVETKAHVDHSLFTTSLTQGTVRNAANQFLSDQSCSVAEITTPTITYINGPA